MVSIWVALTAAFILTVAGCAGGNEKSTNAPGSVPVKTVTIPTVTTRYAIRSSSMEPMLHCAKPNQGCEAQRRDGVITEEPAPEPRRADIVVFQTPGLALRECGAFGKFVERVIGLPGDRWELRAGFVYINGKRLDEPYVKPAHRDHQTLGLSDVPPPHTYKRIPAAYYLMMGDNRNSSCDSRRWGLVPRGNLIGKVVEIVRPTTG